MLPDSERQLWNVFVNDFKLIKTVNVLAAVVVLAVTVKNLPGWVVWNLGGGTYEQPDYCTPLRFIFQHSLT